ncbi:MAG: SDR family oxidoreductase [Gemmatimonadota bacterium]
MRGSPNASRNVPASESVVGSAPETAAGSASRPASGSAAGPVVLIAGAGGGIGSAIARRYAREGARLALLDLDAPRMARLAGALAEDGTAVLTLICDITDPQACAEAVPRVEEEWGGVDVLIHCAGVTHLSFVDETNPSVFRHVMDVNFFGAVHVTRAALPALIRSRGAIAVLSSVAGFAPLSGRSGYAASKHALHGFFASLRGELKEKGVSVTLICPSFVRTDIGGRALGGDGGPAAAVRTETGRVMDPDRVARAVLAAVRRRRRLAVLPLEAKLAWILWTFFPGLYERIMIRRLAEEQRR